MIEFITHKAPFFSRKEVWFYNGEAPGSAAYMTFSAARKVLEGKNVFLERYQTCIIDLGKSEDELYKGIHPTYRYDIRNAEKQGIEVEFCISPESEACDKLALDYNVFAKKKKLGNLSCRWLRTIAKSGNLAYSRALYEDTIVATHLYLFDKKTVSLVSSFHNTDFDNDKIRSEANKLLHFKDVLYFKRMGLKYYDFGGLNRKKLPGVSKFKTSFGGEIIENFRYIQTSQLLYRLIQILKKIKL